MLVETSPSEYVNLSAKLVNGTRFRSCEEWSKGSCPYPGVSAPRYITIHHHEMGEGTNIAENIRRISACEEAVLGAAFLGTGLFLCHSRRVDERDDSGVSFASFEPKPHDGFDVSSREPAAQPAEVLLTFSPRFQTHRLQVGGCLVFTQAYPSSQNRSNQVPCHFQFKACLLGYA